jgi:hypothetical protein
MNNAYYAPIVVNGMFALMAVSELIADEAIDWLDVYWLAAIVGILLLATTFFVSFTDENRKPRIIAAALGILSVVVWLIALFGFSS